MRVERREVLPASRSVADSRQVPSGGTVRLQQTALLGRPTFLTPPLQPAAYIPLHTVEERWPITAEMRPSLVGV